MKSWLHEVTTASTALWAYHGFRDLRLLENNTHQRSEGENAGTLAILKLIATLVNTCPGNHMRDPVCGLWGNENDKTGTNTNEHHV